MHRHADVGGDVDDAAGGLALQRFRAAARVPVGRRPAGGDVAAHQRGDDVPVFGVDDGQRAGVAGGLQGQQQLVVGQAQAVGHVELEAATTGGAGRGGLLQPGDVARADGHVQAVVDDRAGGDALPRGQRGQHRLVRSRLHEVNDGRRAAKGRRARAVEEVVGGGEAADGHVQMDVAVDRAGQDVLAGGVDLAASAQVLADGGDVLAVDGHVGRVDGVGGDERAVADNEVVGGGGGGHGSPGVGQWGSRSVSQ